MKVSELIVKKKTGGILTKEEIDFLISGYSHDTIPDYQISALLMAICYQGMDEHETSYLTEAMIKSGETINLKAIKGVKVDKHSTGGVGDKTSLVLGPLVASCGVKVAKMSGRGLGHTGGTLDKLEAIPGLSIEKGQADFIAQVQDISLAIIGQTGNLVPADKKLYALRDVTGTVDSIPLISASIMSKKIATGADAILLDVKCGNGAFMKTIEDARTLALTMCKIGKKLNRDTRAIITNMRQPLGLAIGNILEVVEAVETLKGHGPQDLLDLCLDAGAIMLIQAGVIKNKDDGIKMLKEKIASGAAYQKFREMVAHQGGDVSYIDHPEKFKKAKYIIDIKSAQTGYVEEIIAVTLGEVAMKLGAGREKKEDNIDPSAGIVLKEKVGAKVYKGDVIATIHTDKANYQEYIEELKTAFRLKMEQYLSLCREVLLHGQKKSDRTGTGVISSFALSRRYSLADSFPLLTTKKVSFHAVLVELLWFISGSTNIQPLVQQNVRIWNEWPYRKFQESADYTGQSLEEFIERVKSDDAFAKKYGELGPVYGYQWRHFNGVDQIKELEKSLKEDPYSRRHILTAWNPGDIKSMLLPPCHAFVQFYVDQQNRLSCHLYQRSGDIFLGVPFNIASYSLLTMMLAKTLDLKLGEFVHTIGDAHIYLNHLEQVNLQLSRTPTALPNVVIKNKRNSITEYTYEDFELVNYQPQALIKGRIPWDNKEDLLFFKETTLNHSVIMGEVTYYSIGRLLPKRTNYIASLKPLQVEGAIIVNDLHAFLKKKKAEKENLFVIGGAQIYALALEYADQLILSRIPGDYSGDRYFPNYRERFALKKEIKKNTFNVEYYEVKKC
ncbi:thymidine phosphorylase [Holotrichia oblita]|nr:thymidine phosphorylase [Holotrichia oblita]